MLEKLATQDTLAVTQDSLATMLFNMETIHQRIKRLRSMRGLSMQALAKACGVSSWQTVQQWEKETGGTAPSRKRLHLVAEALGVSVPELLGADESASPPENTKCMEEAAAYNIARMTTRWPFRMIDEARFMALPVEARMFIEGRILTTIEEWEARQAKRAAQ